MDRRSQQRIIRQLRERMPTMEADSCRMSHKVEGMIESSEEVRGYSGLHVLMPQTAIQYKRQKHLLDFLSLVCFVQAREREQIMKAHIWILSGDKWTVQGAIGFVPDTTSREGEAKRLLKSLLHATKLKDRNGNSKGYTTAPAKGLMDHGALVVSLGTNGNIYRQLRKQGWPKRSLNVWELMEVSDAIQIHLNGRLIVKGDLQC